jgi:predicted DNA-binding transcriptional regulator AlpA
MQTEEVFLPSRKVKERYGNVSDMWIWRRLHEEGSNFPQPLRINGRRFWRLQDLVNYEGSLETA